MAGRDTAHVDVSALLDVARQYQAAADAVDGAVRTHLAALAFDGSSAGKAHVARGDSVRIGVISVVDRLRRWSRASAEIAAVLTTSADRYAEADAGTARRLG